MKTETLAKISSSNKKLAEENVFKICKNRQILIEIIASDINEERNALIEKMIKEKLISEDFEEIKHLKTKIAEKKEIHF